MKRILIGLFAVILVIFLLLAFLILWNRNYYCNPCNKEWYNNISLPSVSKPFTEIYDGSYSIKIDKDGNVVFKPLDGEEMNGKITVTPHNKYTAADIHIDFEDGTIIEGHCYRSRNGRYLSFEYNSWYYHFTEKQKLSKEEFEEYRNGLIEFMYEIYEGGEFPTTQEIKENDLYKEYLDYYQIDPGCGGPIVYDVVTKATIESIDFENNTMTMIIDGETRELMFGDKLVVMSISDGRFVELTADDLVTGECLVVDSSFESGLDRSHIAKIYYLEDR